MATIKAGTYTMKEVLSTPIVFDYTGKTPLDIGFGDYFLDADWVNEGSAMISHTDTSITAWAENKDGDYQTKTIYSDGYWGEENYNVWTFKSDYTVTDETYAWFTSNLYVPEAKFVRLIREDEVSGTDLNIAYGETAPEDTSKLWVSGAEPSKVSTAFKVEGEESLTENVGSLPAAYGIGAAAVGKKVYLFGGTAYDLAIRCFDTEAKTTTALSATLPEALANMGCAAVGAKVYLFGGHNSSYSYSNSICCFDTETGAISKLSTTLPAASCAMGCAAVGTKVYLFGGGGSSYSSAIYCFDTEVNTITALSASLPTTRKYIGCAAVGTKVYLFGGTNGSSSSYRYDTICVFDTEAKTITTLSTTLPVTKYAMAAATVGTKIYLIGGYPEGEAIYSFDTETEAITTLSKTLPSSTQYIGVGIVGTQIYLCGGLASSALPTINLFSIAFDLPTDNLLLHLSSTENLFKLINADTASIEVGLQGVYRGNADGVGEMETAYLHDGTDWVEV